MKKTITLLVALAGMASADSSITLGSYFTDKNGVNVFTVEAVQGKSKSNAAALGLTKADGLNSRGFSFAMDASEMLYSAALTLDDVIQVTQITLASNSQYDSAETGRLSITLGNNTYVSEVGVEERISGYGTITYSFTGENSFALGISDTMSASIATEANNVFIGVFQGQSGVDGLTAPNGYSVWSPGVMITGVKLIPEPTTATLSLLALAGLASRRRRK